MSVQSRDFKSTEITVFWVKRMISMGCVHSHTREIVSSCRTDLDPFHGQTYFLDRCGLNFCKSPDQKFVNSSSFNFFPNVASLEMYHWS